MVLLLSLVYNTVPVHNSLIPWSTGTTEVRVGRPLAVSEQDYKKLIFKAHGFDH